MSISGGKTSDASIFMQWDPNSSNGGGGNGSVTNPLSNNLDAGGYQITNTTNLLEIPIDQDLDMNDHKVVNVTQLKFSDNTVLEPYDGNLKYGGENVIVSGSAGFWLGDYTMGNNDISNVGTINGGTSTFTTYNVGANGSINFPNSRSIHLIPNGVDLAIGSNNSEIILTSNNYESHITAGSEFNQITIGTAPNDYTIGVNPSGNILSLYDGSTVQPSDLIGELAYISPVNGLSTSRITFTDEGDTQLHHLTLTTSEPYQLQIDGNTILTTAYAKASELVLLDNAVEHTLNFDAVLKIDNNEVITSATIDSYVESASGLTNYQKKVSENDLDMNNHNLENVNSITFNGSAADALVISNNRLQFNDGTHFKRCYKQLYNIPSNSSNSIQTIPLEFVTETITNYCIVTITGLVLCIGTLTGANTNGASTKYIVTAKAGSDGMFTILSETQETEYSTTYTVMGSPKQDEITFENSTSDYQINMKYDYYSDPAQTIVNTYDVTYVII
jgi:hypothetical protein